MGYNEYYVDYEDLEEAFLTDTYLAGELYINKTNNRKENDYDTRRKII